MPNENKRAGVAVPPIFSRKNKKPLGSSRLLRLITRPTKIPIRGGFVIIALIVTKNGRLELDKMSIAINVRLKIRSPSIVIIETIVRVFDAPNISSAMGKTNKT